MYLNTGLQPLELSSPSTLFLAPELIRAQSTVDVPIGHVNVLSDYKETGPEKKCKF